MLLQSHTLGHTINSYSAIRVSIYLKMTLICEPDIVKHSRGLLISTFVNSSTNFNHHCLLNAVSFCNTCSLYGNIPMSSHTVQYVVDHETLCCCARCTIEVRGSKSANFIFRLLRARTSFHTNLPFQLVINTTRCIKRV